MAEYVIRIPNTVEGILEDFNKGKLCVNIKDASINELTKFKELTLAKRWMSGHEFDSPELRRYTEHDTYVVFDPTEGGCKYATNGINSGADCSMTIKDFLAMFDNETKKECEIRSTRDGMSFLLY